MLSLLCVFLAIPARAEEIPAAIQSLLSDQSQAYLLGTEKDLQVFFLEGPQQHELAYFQNERAFTGKMTDETGADLSEKYWTVAKDKGLIAEATSEPKTNQSTESAGDKFLNEISQLRVLTYGPEDGKGLYVFMDPNCPYCHQFFETVMGKIAAGKAIHLFVIPTPVLGKDSLEKVVKIYGAGDPSATWESYMKDKTLLDAPTDKSVLESVQQAIQANMQSFQRWKLSSVPLIVWRGSNNRVMINIGTPNDVQEFFHALGTE